MRYNKPETEIVAFEGYISTSDYSGLINSNDSITNDGTTPPFGGETELPDEEW